ncbi:hypothetical protein [Hydrogenophaga sp.]|uniref:hypothetical protein n=1 Tax=Hydrogenophaga sp. TaxID=1904254 RepID=UPI0027177AE8|nr:hypothetical protein [Hydrogenophaga sp.]MDO9605031.1 hypothetical protein [Hydrogenophaga sp.]
MKRNCVWETEREKEAWSMNREPMNKSPTEERMTVAVRSLPAFPPFLCYSIERVFHGKPPGDLFGLACGHRVGTRGKEFSDLVHLVTGLFK